MNNYFFTEFSKACQAQNTNPTAWAEANGLSTGTPTALKNGTRPSTETLKKLVSSWEKPETGVLIAAAYLKDEIERMGVSLEAIEPVIRSSAPSPKLDDALKTISEFMNREPIRDSILKLAALLEASEWKGSPLSDRAAPVLKIKSGAPAPKNLKKMRTSSR